jgi:hypothetical protein
MGPCYNPRHESRSVWVGVNLKRGFNRLYIVLAVGWAIYCLFVYPEKKSLEITGKWMEEQKGCYVEADSVRTESEIPLRVEESKKCFEAMDRNYRTELSMWSGKGFYLRAWSILLVAVVAFPIVLYGCCRGAAAVAVWIWQGFRASTA